MLQNLRSVCNISLLEKQETRCPTPTTGNRGGKETLILVQSFFITISLKKLVIKKKDKEDSLAESVFFKGVDLLPDLTAEQTEIIEACSLKGLQWVTKR